MNAVHKAARLAHQSGVIWATLPTPAILTILSDAGEVIADCNPAAETFLSASAQQVIGTSLAGRILVGVSLNEAIGRARMNRAPIFINDVEVGRDEAHTIKCNIQIAPLNDPAMSVMILLIPRDIAGRLGRTQAVQSAAKSAIGMAEMLAHEIKNPLAGITGAAQLLSMNLTDEDRELTDLIVAECKRIVKLLEQVEQFGDQRPPERRGINVHDVLERARRSAEIGFGVHMTFADDYDPSLPEVYADPDQLLQVILNLLKNAAQAQPEGGEITIRTYYERGLHVQGRGGDRVPLPVHIEIIDNGPGLPAGIADSIFEPFVSGRENGTGLGLALVSKIISAHEGWIEVKSRPGRTLFRVSLPLMRANTPRKV